MNKRFLLASAAVAVIASSGQAQAGDFYVSVLGGANWARDFSANVTECCGTTTGHASAKVDTGFMIGGAVGVHLDHWLHGLRAELEASYRRNRIHGDWFTSSESSSETGVFRGHMSAFAIMANLWYDIDIGMKFVPYVGGGAGWGRRQVTFVANESDDLRMESNFGRDSVYLERSGFVYQLGAGVNYEIMHDVQLGLGYRFFHAQDIKGTLEIEENDAPLNISGDNHSVALSLTIGID